MSSEKRGAARGGAEVAQNSVPKPESKGSLLTGIFSDGATDVGSNVENATTGDDASIHPNGVKLVHPTALIAPPSLVVPGSSDTAGLRPFPATSSTTATERRVFPENPIFAPVPPAVFSNANATTTMRTEELVRFKPHASMRENYTSLADFVGPKSTHFSRARFHFFSAATVPQNAKNYRFVDSVAQKVPTHTLRH